MSAKAQLQFTTPDEMRPPGTLPWRLWRGYRLRWRRRYFLWRSWKKRHELQPVQDRTSKIVSGHILCFATMRNEAERLPYWLEHHRKLGVDHFLIVENDSTDDTKTMLAQQPDVSLWTTTASYRRSRFGVDWLTSLMIRYGHRHWCLTLDADELLIYAHHEHADLHSLTGWLESRGQESFGALMLDLFPKGPLGQTQYQKGEDPTRCLPWFDPEHSRHPRGELQTLLIRGGIRARAFFASEPEKAPTMNKTPLVRWSRQFAYMDSTHAVLPRRLNRIYDMPGVERARGVLLHTKFLSSIVEKSLEEKERRQHFQNSALYEGYYDQLIGDPNLWHEGSVRYEGWQQLEDLGLLSGAGWTPEKR